MSDLIVRYRVIDNTIPDGKRCWRCKQRAARAGAGLCASCAHPHVQARATQQQRTAGTPAKAHDVRQQWHFPPPGFLAYALLGRVIPPLR